MSLAIESHCVTVCVFKNICRATFKILLRKRCEKYDLKTWKHISSYFVLLFFDSFFSFFRKNYLLLSYASSVRPSVVCENNFLYCNLISNRPIYLKIGLNVGYGVVNVPKALLFKIQIASRKFMQLTMLCK